MAVKIKDGMILIAEIAFYQKINNTIKFIFRSGAVCSVTYDNEEELLKDIEIIAKEFDSYNF